MMVQTLLDFDGSTYNRDRDQIRLNAQLQRVIAAMRDGTWRTLAQISALTDDPEASVSARLRDLRKDRFGASIVERTFIDERNCWTYRLLLSAGAAKAMGE